VSVPGPGTPERRALDKERIDDPLSWPMMRLPVKNPGRYNTDKPHMGYLFTGSEWGTEWRTITLANVFTDGEDTPPRTEEYESTDAMLDAGWTID
jgi:hypothetical protein